MENPHQINFFQNLKEIIPAHLSMVNEISDILNISQDSTYRRIRGETALSIDETIRLCEHYKIPLSNFDKNTPGRASFGYIPYQNKKEMFSGHLKAILQNMELLATSEQKQIIYGAIDAPIFHFFAFPAISAFKMHFWMNTIMGVEDLKGSYKKEHIDPEFIDMGKQIHEYYLHTPSIEIWPDDILTTTLKQLMYYWDAGNFSSIDDAIEILDSLLIMTGHVEQMAEKSLKFSFGDKNKTGMAPFNFYQSELLLGNNVILTTADNSRRVYISHQTFGAIVIENELYFENTEKWMKRIIGKSNLISGVSEKTRIKFFNNVRIQIEEFSKRIKASETAA